MTEIRSKDTATPEQSRETHGIGSANEYILHAEALLIEITNIESAIMKGDRSLKTGTIVAKHHVVSHSIGLAFEFLYKTTILIEGKEHEPRHPINVLHKQLTKGSKEKFEKVIAEYGWKEFNDFSCYVDHFLTNPRKKYYEGGFAPVLPNHYDPELYYRLIHPKSFIDLYYQFRDIVAIIATENQKTLFPSEGIIFKNEHLN